MVKSKNSNKGIEDLKKLGVVLGFTPIAYLDLIENGKIEISENKTLEGILNQVNLGRIEGAYINISVANHIMKNWRKNKKLVFNKNLPFTKSTRHISTIKYSKIIKKFDEFLIEEKDTINKLKEKYKVEEGIE